MKYDKSVFKNHYGKPYISRIRIDILVCVACALAICLLLLLQITIAPIAAGLLLFPIVISFFPVLPLLICSYIKAKRTSERQYQAMRDGILIVDIVPEAGFTWGGIVNHTLHYEVKHVSSVSYNTRYIVVEGDIELTEDYNDNVTKTDVPKMKIPIVFTGFERILSLGGSKNG